MNKLSVILLSYFSSDRIRVSFDKLSKIFLENEIDFEFIVMDDGSTDSTLKLAQELEKEHKNVKVYQLSKNYTSHYSIFAGLSICVGDCATIISDDEQQPYTTIVEMYKYWLGGDKIIMPYRDSRNDGFFNNLFANLYYRLINITSDIHFPKGGADSFFIDREIIDIINSRIHPINTSIITEILRLGFQPKFIPYHRVKGINQKSRWTLKKKVRLFKDTFFSCSSVPIKLISFLGVFFSIFSFILILFYIYVAIMGETHGWKIEVKGWTSTIIIISFFSGLILFSLGIIAEYIWRIYEEVKNRPGYIIKQNCKNKYIDESRNNLH